MTPCGARPPLAITIGLTATVVKAAGALLALALARSWRRVIPRVWLLPGATTGSSLLVCYGAVQVAAGALVLAAAVHPSGTVDRTALSWHVAVWDMWFLLRGPVVSAATRAMNSGVAIIFPRVRVKKRPPASSS